MTIGGQVVCLHCIASGRVQAVGFRAFVVTRARALGLAGWVRNREDGRSVEVWAEGPRADLERLRDALARGPGAAHVERLECQWCAPAGLFDGFEVRR